MWGEHDKVWTHYRKDVMAADSVSAAVLISYLRHVAVNRLQAYCLEIVDIQRYKVIRRMPKVRSALKDRTGIPFVFVVGKN